MPEPARRRLARDWSRPLAALYSFFALAAGSRAVVELIVAPDRAPVAYALSALSAGFYLIGAVAFRMPGPRARRIALVACGFELVAVVVVGSLTLGDPRRWGDLTVWSSYGESYGFIPVLLPLLGLAFLRASGRSLTPVLAQPSGFLRRRT